MYMSTRPERKQLTTIPDILDALGDPDKVGKNQVWVGKDYSLRDLIQDLQRVSNESGNGAG
jgi:hypothetical protein